MNTEHIKEFVLLASNLNFSKAAEDSFISQSSLSKHIRILEKELGTHLFIRTTRSIRLTEAGIMFLPYAKKIIGLCDSYSSELELFSSRDNNKLVVGIISNPQYYDLAGYMIGFMIAEPDINFNLIEADEIGLLEMFKQRKYNLFTAFPPSELTGNYEFLPMVETKFVALVNTSHPLANKTSLSLKDLSGEKILIPGRNSTLQTIIKDAMIKQGLEFCPTYEGSSIGSIELLKAGMGISLHSVEFSNNLPNNSNIQAIPIEPDIKFVYGIGHRPIDELSSSEKKYLNYLKQFELKKI